MKRTLALVAALAVVAATLSPSPAGAQLQPHRAEYSLRLGTALNGTRIGKIVQDIALDCDGWHIRRELTVEMSLTPTLKVGITSRMEGAEQRGGGAFTWQTAQVVNGAERDVRGTAQREAGGYRVELAAADGPEQAILSPLTLMPVAAVDYLVRRLIAGSEAFPVLLLGPEAEGAAFLVDVRRATAGTPEASPPAQRYVKVPGARSWPFITAITRPGQRDAKPPLALRGRIFESGVMDGLVVDAGVVTVAAYLRNLEMRDAPSCPR